MKKVDSKRATLFVIVFATLALIINSLHSRIFREEYVHQGSITSQTRSEVAVPSELKNVAKPAGESVKEDPMVFINRYINPDGGRKGNSTAVAIIAVSEKGAFNYALNSAISKRFSGASVQALPSLFNLNFVSDGLFSQVFNGSREVFLKLKLGDQADTLVMARQDVQYTKNPSLQDLITATMKVEVMVVSVKQPEHTRTWAHTAAGPGFNKMTARISAEERLLKQLQEDPRLSLNN